jgi:hypothetical protein
MCRVLATNFFPQSGGRLLNGETGEVFYGPGYTQVYIWQPIPATIVTTTSHSELARAHVAIDHGRPRLRLLGPPLHLDHPLARVSRPLSDIRPITRPVLGGIRPGFSGFSSRPSTPVIRGSSHQRPPSALRALPRTLELDTWPIAIRLRPRSTPTSIRTGSHSPPSGGRWASQASGGILVGSRRRTTATKWSSAQDKGGLHSEKGTM